MLIPVTGLLCKKQLSRDQTDCQRGCTVTWLASHLPATKVLRPGETNKQNPQTPNKQKTTSTTKKTTNKQPNKTKQKKPEPPTHSLSPASPITHIFLHGWRASTKRDFPREGSSGIAQLHSWYIKTPLNDSVTSGYIQSCIWACCVEGRGAEVNLTCKDSSFLGFTSLLLVSLSLWIHCSAKKVWHFWMVNIRYCSTVLFQSSNSF